MSAIERYRTAALGGHVMRCENDACGYTAIAYNSCRNRHCPKCQGLARAQWLVDRQGHLLRFRTALSPCRVESAGLDRPGKYPGSEGGEVIGLIVGEEEALRLAGRFELLNLPLLSACRLV
jgi:Transposase zinc-binding domain